MELVEISIKALYHAVEYTSSIFVSGQGEIIMDCIYKCVNRVGDEPIQTVALQCVVEIVRFHYQYLDKIIIGIRDNTFVSMERDDIPTRAQAIEVWTSIAEEEHAMEQEGKPHLNLISNIFTDLKDKLFTCLGCLEFFEGMSDHEWGASTSAGACLKGIAFLLKNDVITPVLAFAGDQIVMDDPKEIYIGLLSLGTITEGPSSSEIADQFKPAISILINLLDHTHQNVRGTAAWLIYKLMQNAHSLFDQATFGLLYEKMLILVKTDQEVGGLLCQTCGILQKKLFNENTETSMLSKAF